MIRFNITFTLLLSLCSMAQKQGNTWYFGNQAGLNFNGGAPVVITGGQTGTGIASGDNQEGTACISDSSGAILFYTNGNNIWNKNHQVMLNGSGIMGGVSSTQAALIVPQPGNDSLFYVFTSDEWQSYTPGPAVKGYRYSVVNMCLDNGKGAVSSGKKNILLADSATEKLSACRDAAGAGYWVLGHKMFSDQFQAWHLTSAGITATVVSRVGLVHGYFANPGPSPWMAGMAQGQMKFNPAGTRIGLVHGNVQPARIELFDFNNNSGVVTNPCRIVTDSAMLKSGYGFEFSPDGLKAYVPLTGGSGGNLLHQFDLGAGACPAVRASDVMIFQTSVNDPGMLGMQLAPDKKIYIAAGYSLTTINLPNLAGTACSITPAGVGSATFNNTYLPPNFVANYSYTNKLLDCRVVISGVKQTDVDDGLHFRMFPNPSTGAVTVTAATDMEHLEVMDRFGRLLYQCKPGMQQHSFELERSGIYFVRIYSGHSMITQKLVVNHD